MTYKQMIMTFLVNRRLERIILLYWRFKGQHVSHLNEKVIGNRFEEIYQLGLWSKTESYSGSGSTVAGTKNVRDALPQLLNKLNTQVLIDIGCGDFNWMKHVRLDCKYVGIDIVDSVIKNNIENYHSNVHEFLTFDATKDPLPDGDTIICREVMFHLCFNDCRKLFDNIRRSKAMYVLLTTDPTVNSNPNIPTGAWREINLRVRPFCLPEPIEIIHDPQIDNDSRILGLWRSKDLCF
jgi:hypothetical protein